MTLRSSILLALGGVTLGLVGAAAAASPISASVAATRAIAASPAQSEVYVTARTSRRIAPPVRRSRWDGPPRGAYLVRDRYWQPSLRWKTDPYSRTVYAVSRGEVWFLDPVSGWGHTVDRYGRVYVSDPRYRAVYSYGTIGDWEGDLPYFFSYYAPQNGYYSLPRYRSYVDYYVSPRYRYYDYPVAQDYWWDTYETYYSSPTYVTNINFVFYNDRNVRYDRHYHRDVYLGARGRAFIAPPPPSYRGSRQATYFASQRDAQLPTIASTTDYAAPTPVAAQEVLTAAPAVEVAIAAALPINAAESVAETGAAVPATAELAQIETQTLAAGEKPVSVMGTELASETAPPPETATPETAAQAVEAAVIAAPVAIAVDPATQPGDSMGAEGGVISTAPEPALEAATPGPANSADPVVAPVADPGAVKQVEELAPPEAASTEIPPVDPMAPAVDSLSTPETGVPVTEGLDSNLPAPEAQAAPGAFDTSRQDEIEDSSPPSDQAALPDYDDTAQQQEAYEKEQAASQAAGQQQDSFEQETPAYVEPQQQQESFEQEQPAFEERQQQQESFEQEQPAYEEPAPQESFQQEQPAYEEPAPQQESFEQEQPAYEEPPPEEAAEEEKQEENAEIYQ